MKSYLNEYHSIVIDSEYQGKENLIKSLLLNYIRTKSAGFNPKLIKFGRITKNSNAHAAATDVFRGHRKPNLILTLSDTEKWLYSKQKIIEH